VRVLSLGVLLLLIAAPLAARQTLPPLTLELRQAEGGVRVTLGPVLESPRIQSALESGLPVRIRLVTELWRDRAVDALEGRHEWRASVRRDPLSDRFLVDVGNARGTAVTALEEAARMLQAALQVPLTPPRPGDYYFLARMEVETLSLSDLEELRRWMDGDLRPAVGSDDDVGGALGRGLRRLMVRILGLPVQRYQARTPRFTWR
jgi:hypothetical protein